ncbi:MAG: sigma-70 family RNA polymerase sigma factor [Bacteroidota bacterium]
MNTLFSFSDEQIIAGLLAGGQQEHQSLKYLYTTHQKKIISYVTNNQGTEWVANDIFQEGILILYKQIRKGKFRGESAIGTYLYGICRYLWLNKLKEIKSHRRVNDQLVDHQVEEESIDPYRPVFQQEEREKIYSLFSMLKHHCKEVLIYSIVDEYSMEVVAEKLGFDNAQIARNKKYKCLKRLRKYLADNPGISAQIRELQQY